VPERSEKSGGIEHSLADLVVTAPFSLFAESVRRITARIDHLQRGQTEASRQADAGGTVVLFTSSVPREGKSTLSLSVARSLAAAGKRVLLIDADLRKPSLHALLDIAPSTKLREFLHGRQPGTTFAGLFASDPAGDVTVIAGQPGVDYPTDHLFDGPKFEQLLTAARRHFGFVVRWASTSQAMARQSLASLSAHARGGAPVFVILNHKERGKAVNFYQSSGYYYS
jgi:Mrp family chromosome partitioning ATPase